MVLAAERAEPADLARLAGTSRRCARSSDFAAYRQADVFFHLGLAEAAGSARLVAAMTEVQGGMSELIGHIAHPPEVLERSNAQHAKLVGCSSAARPSRRRGWCASTCRAPSACSRD